MNEKWNLKCYPEAGSLHSQFLRCLTMIPAFAPYLQDRRRACAGISSARYSRHVQPGSVALRITLASLLNIRVRRRWCRVIGVPYSLQELPGHGYLSNTATCNLPVSHRQLANEIVLDLSSISLRERGIWRIIILRRILTYFIFW